MALNIEAIDVTFKEVQLDRNNIYKIKVGSESEKVGGKAQSLNILIFYPEQPEGAELKKQLEEAGINALLTLKGKLSINFYKGSTSASMVLEEIVSAEAREIIEKVEVQSKEEGDLPW